MHQWGTDGSAQVFNFGNPTLPDLGTSQVSFSLSLRFISGKMGVPALPQDAVRDENVHRALIKEHTTPSFTPGQRDGAWGFLYQNQ